MASVTQYLANTLGKWDQKWQGTGGAAHVLPLSGTGSVSQNRELLTVNAPAAEIPVAGDLHTATWTTGDNVLSLTVMVVAGSTTALSDSTGIYIVFDATSDADATFKLTKQADSVDASIDTFRYFVKAGEPRSFNFTSELTRVDCIGNINTVAATSDDLDVFLEAN